MTLTPQQVAEKKFTSTRFKNGYDETEVDAFLDEVEAELTRLNDEAEKLRRQLDGAQLAQAVQTPVALDEPVVPVESGAAKPNQAEMEEMLRRTLLLAQRTADEVVAEARAEAEKHLGDARAEAQALRLESERRAAEHEQAATMRASVATAESEATKRRLEEQVAALHAFESDFRGRLRAYLELQLGDLEATVLTPSGEVAAALPARTPAAETARFATPTQAPVEPASPAAPAAVPEPGPHTADALDDDGEPLPPLRSSEGAPAVLPDLPPLPSWMSADAGFGTDDESAVDHPAQLPEGA